MTKDEILTQKGVLYLYEDYEDAVFKFTGTGKGNYCTVKFRGKEPYQIECTTNLACQSFLGGDIITKEEYEKF